MSGRQQSVKALVALMTTTKTKPTLKAAKQRLLELSTEELEKCLTMTTATDAEKQCVL